MPAINIFVVGDDKNGAREGRPPTFPPSGRCRRQRATEDAEARVNEGRPFIERHARHRPEQERRKAVGEGPARPTYESAWSAVPGVQHVVDAGTVTGTQRLTITTGLYSTSSAAATMVKQIRDVAAPAGSHVLVGGDTAALIDGKTAISSRLLLAGGIIVVTTFILLFCSPAASCSRCAHCSATC